MGFSCSYRGQSSTGCLRMHMRMPLLIQRGPLAEFRWRGEGFSDLFKTDRVKKLWGLLQSVTRRNLRHFLCLKFRYSVSNILLCRVCSSAHTDSYFCALIVVLGVNQMNHDIELYRSVNRAYFAHCCRPLCFCLIECPCRQGRSLPAVTRSKLVSL